ncbi:MAG: hypothetical protein GF317_20870 [Candidatus Lokiarchaeota archaeon]|nr:hypothetical protein [Candidatus Lokiarchaeota archaeon]MBD3201898.1 hypothetical protein [Candidatus Lokiarchaeota archaeon]
MTEEKLEPLDEIIQKIKDYEEKHGLICLNCLLVKSRFDEIRNFIQQNKINIPKEEDLSKFEYLKYISSHFYKEFETNPEIKNQYASPLKHIGIKILEDEKLKHYLTRFDFFAKQDLIDAFSDWCADLGITIYDTSKIDKYSLDLYLIRRTPLLRTEAVVVRTGDEFNEENYKDTFYILNEASKMATWTVLVTTPLGVYNIGLDRLISDMEKLDTWLYVIDPLHSDIWGITKGGKSKNYDSDERDKYIEQLPKEPIRAPSKVVKISNYKFDDGISYNAKNFGLFELYSKDQMEEREEEHRENPKYREIFRNLMVIDKDNGLPMISYSSEEQPLDKVLISGFLTAMDNFVSELGGGSDTMKDINYKGLYVQASYGEYIKIALFLSESADKSLIERLNYLTNYLETHYGDEIKEFRESGSTTIFDIKKINPLFREILDI